MNSLDLIILIVFLIGIVQGFLKGLVHELAVLIAYGGGIFAGFKLSSFVLKWLGGFFDEVPEILPLLCFALVFIGVVVLVFFIGRWVDVALKITLLKSVDRIAGMFFGGLKMLFLAAILLVLIDRKIIQITEISESAATSIFYSPMVKLANYWIPDFFFLL